MELRHLRYFVAVAEELHFTRAAKRLGMAQQPLSAQIKQLEEELGVDLFSRASSGTKLTPAGGALLPEARAILAHVERARRVAELAAEGALGTLRVGFCEVVFEAVLARVVAQFLEERPRLHVELRSLPTPEQHALLDRGEIDLAFGGAPADGARFATRVLAREPLVAMMSAAAAAGRSSISLAELLDHPLVLLSRTGNAPHRTQLDRVLSRARYIIRQEAHDKPMLLNLVRAGVGVTMLPRHASNALPGGVVAVPVADLREDYALVAAWRIDEPSIAGHAFVEAAARELSREAAPASAASTDHAS